jgi:predicted ATPase
VLDNCEHLVQACAQLAKLLLQAGGRVKILASSREHFNVAGETIYTVPPLSIPRATDRISAESILQCEAVHLLVERTMAVQPAFRLTEQNALAIVEICQRLDGIPLALELAAARARALSIERIAERVNDRFRLLTTGDRTALPRQQTLRAMIDWSFDLLTDREKTVFRRLAVFAGGWTLEAAEVVASGGDVDESDVLDLLAGLVDKSLVMVPAEGGRYGLLETVRQYADERLKEFGEGEEVRRRHLDFYLAFAEKAGTGLARAAGCRPGESALRACVVPAHIGWCRTRLPPGARDQAVLVHARPAEPGSPRDRGGDLGPAATTAKPGAMQGALGCGTDLQLHGSL